MSVTLELASEFILGSYPLVPLLSMILCCHINDVSLTSLYKIYNLCSVVNLWHFMQEISVIVCIHVFVFCCQTKEMF